ncbi:MAG: PrsW family intramembrane metalloprotease [Spirochaetales bacterium]|nr:PrsW family intramembrane metalloprotease [Spirochaetales bacterium]
MLILLGNIGLAVLPALVLLLVFHKTGPELPWSGLYKPLLFGYVIVVPAFVIEIGLDNLLGMLLDGRNGILRLLLFSFVIAALIEEFFKLVVVSRISRNYANARELIAASFLAGVGFALFENLKYIFGPSRILLLRSLTAVPLHGICAAFIGYGLAVRTEKRKSAPLAGFLLAVVFHGLYDLFLMIGTTYSSLVLVLLLIMTAIITVLYNLSVPTRHYFRPKN